jgi:hypothetical protein
MVLGYQPVPSNVPTALSSPRRRGPSKFNNLDSRLRGNDRFLEVSGHYPTLLNKARVVSRARAWSTSGDG